MRTARIDRAAVQYGRLGVLRQVSRSFLIVSLVLAVGMGLFIAVYPASLETFGVPIILLSAGILLGLPILFLVGFIRFGAISSRLGIVLFLLAMGRTLAFVVGGLFLTYLQSLPVMLFSLAVSGVGTFCIVEFVFYSLALFFATSAQRELLREKMSVATLIGGPPALSVLVGGSIVTYLLFVLASSLHATAAAITMYAALTLGSAPSTFIFSCRDAVAECASSNALLFKIIGSGLFVAAGLIVAGGLVRRLARQRVREECCKGHAA